MPIYPRDLFPATRAHEGVWEGTYIYLDAEAHILDRHAANVRCEFPDDGTDVFYRQHIHFQWEDGRTRDDVFEGIPQDRKLWYDTPTFKGFSWETDDGLILLNLQRKDEPGVNFFEIIMMGDGGQHRARTWHWFEDGRLIRRTLCNESRIG